MPAGQLRKIANGDTAVFFPDGKRIAYCSGTSLYVAQVDGANVRKISDVGCTFFHFALAISPDGSRIRFPISDPNRPDILRYWEIHADGTQLQQLGGPTFGWSGKWTRDGKFFVFEQMNVGRTDLWFLPDSTGFVLRLKAPIRATNGPLSFDAPLPSRDGRRIFAIGYQGRGELIRYDSRSKQFLPFLGGISATDVVYSPDGKWLIYLSYPNHELWRSRADGTERLQLTFAPMQVFWPHISPDATKVEFLGLAPNRGWGTYIVDMAGGDTKFVTEGLGASSWSSDGRSLLVNVHVPGKSTEDQDSRQLAVFDIESGRASMIPDSQGKEGAFQPSPQVIIAGGQQDSLYWFHLPSQKWSVIADGPISNWMLSPDSKYLYFVREMPKNPQAMRIRLSDRKIETIASLEGLRRIADPIIFGSSWIGIAPDGSLVLTRDIGTQEIYALDVKWP